MKGELRRMRLPIIFNNFTGNRQYKAYGRRAELKAALHSEPEPGVTNS